MDRSLAIDEDGFPGRMEAAPGDATQQALKEWFREIDTDRNGSICEKEMREFLQRGDPTITRDQCHLIFCTVDTDNNGLIAFDELVDFAFAPSCPSMSKQLAHSRKNKRASTEKFLEGIREAEGNRRRKPRLERIEIFGAKLGKRVNGVYSLPEEDWVVIASAHVLAYDNMYYNGRPFYQCSKPALYLFYGWTEHRKRFGWFIAKEKPSANDPVTEYILFNPSQKAQTPDLCWASWQASDGSLDKRLLCEAVKKGKERGCRPDDDWNGEGLVGQCLGHELWPWLDDIGIMNSDDDPTFNDWGMQEGEIWLEPEEDGKSDSDFGSDQDNSDVVDATQSLPPASFRMGRRASLGYEMIGDPPADQLGFGRTATLPARRNSDPQIGRSSSIERKSTSKKEEQDLQPGRSSSIERKPRRKKEEQDLQAGRTSSIERKSRSKNEEQDLQVGRTSSAERITKRKKEAQELLNAGSSVCHAPGFNVMGPKGATRDTGPMTRIGSQAMMAPKFKNRRRISNVAADSQTNNTVLASTTDTLPAISVSAEIKKRKDGNFVDTEFVFFFAAPGSKDNCDAESSERAGNSQVMRLPMLNPKACLCQRVQPDDVVCEKAASNIWLMSACAAIAEYPGWIQSVFGSASEISATGKYVVRLFHPARGAFVRVTVDDYVPTTQRSAIVAPACAGIGSEGEIWVPLVEKAFAKLCGSYTNMDHGDTAFGMHYLCGGRGAWTFERMTTPEACGMQSSSVRSLSKIREVEIIADERDFRWRRLDCIWSGDKADTVDGVVRAGELQDRASSETKEMTEPTCGYGADHLWAKLRRFMEKCYPVVAGLDDAKERETGLLASRLYSVTGAREVPVDDARVLRMVCLRDPFGLSGWKGRWSHNSKAWEDNPGVAGLLSYEPKRDGSLWMSYTDFLKYFMVINVCKKSLPVQGSTKEKAVGLKRGLGICTT